MSWTQDGSLCPGCAATLRHDDGPAYCRTCELAGKQFVYKCRTPSCTAQVGPHKDTYCTACEVIRAAVTPTGGALKFDQEKPATELLPFAALTEVSRVLSYGAKKYAAHNWRKGMAWSRLGGGALRHLFAWVGGENDDPETGISHLAHAACCVLFLLEYTLIGGGTDDRWKGV